MAPTAAAASPSCSATAGCGAGASLAVREGEVGSATAGGVVACSGPLRT